MSNNKTILSDFAYNLSLQVKGSEGKVAETKVTLVKEEKLVLQEVVAIKTPCDKYIAFAIFF